MKFILNGIWVFSLILLMNACESASNTNKGENGTDGNEELLSEESQMEQVLKRWLQYSQGTLPKVTLQQFEVIQTLNRNSFLSFELTDFNPKEQQLLAPSPNGKSWLDIYSYSWEVIKNEETKELIQLGPDSEVSVIHMEEGIRLRILFCGTPCIFEDGGWLNNGQVVIAGTSEGAELQTYLTFWKIKLEEKEIQVYQFPEALKSRERTYIEGVVFKDLL